MQPIDTVNRLPREEFAAALKPLFEAATPLANAVYAARPFASYAVLIDTAESLAQHMSEAEQVEVLSAHPRIGASPSTLSAASLREQGNSAEAGMDPAELQRVHTQLADLNERYEQRFGFRFVVFVNRRPKTEILSVLRERFERSREDELAAGLRDMFLIARDRLASTT